MNKRGFAVSIVLYSMVFLIVTILYMLLGIEKTRYTVNQNVRDNIMVQLNDQIEDNRVCEWENDTESNLSSCTATSAATRDAMINDPQEGDVYYTCQSVGNYTRHVDAWVNYVQTETVGGSTVRSSETVYDSASFDYDYDPVTYQITKSAYDKMMEWCSSTITSCENAHSTETDFFCECNATPEYSYTRTTNTYVCK